MATSISESCAQSSTTSTTSPESSDKNRILISSTAKILLQEKSKEIHDSVDSSRSSSESSSFGDSLLSDQKDFDNSSSSSNSPDSPFLNDGSSSSMFESFTSNSSGCSFSISSNSESSEESHDAKPIHQNHKSSSPILINSENASVLDFVTAVQLTDSQSSMTSKSAPSSSSSSNEDVKQYFSEIIQNLYLTSANHITEDNLANHRVTHVVNATRTVPLKRCVRSLRVNILDSAYENIGSYFDSVGEFIHEALRSKGGVAVHCISGISRSSTLVIAFLMKHKNMTLKEAFQLVRSKRWFIRPNTGFFRQLVEYEHQLFGSNTVHMVWSDTVGGHVPDLILEDTSNYKYFYLCIKK